MLPHELSFRPEQDAELFASAPPNAAVFVLRGDEGSEPYVSKTANLRRRLVRLLAAPEGISRRLNLRDRVRTIEYALTGSDFESSLLLYRVLRQTFPRNYAERLRLRFAPLVRLHMENRYPRASVTLRLGGARSASLYYGPFPSRAAAEKFANDVLDGFKMRRCVEELNPDPAFPGCVYSEMKMCLAPCFRGCSDEEYAAEVARVQAFFDSGGQSLARELSAQREKASEGLDFESAAALHARLEKLRPLLQQLPEIVTRIDRLNGLMIQPSVQPESVTLFPLAGGRISDAVHFSLQARQESGKIHSMESRLQEALASAPPPAEASALATMEQLAIVKRWYYRSSKTGEIFFADDRGELPWRRIVRGVSRVFRGDKPAADLSESAREYWVGRGREALGD